MAEPDQPDSESVTGPVAPPVRPVRSAPLRRGSKKRPPTGPDTTAPDEAGENAAVAGGSAGPDAVIPEKVSGEQNTAAAGTDDVVTETGDAAGEAGSTTEKTAAGAGTADQESGPEPSQLERSLGYRERRRPRPVNKDTVTKDRGVAYRGKSVAPVRVIAVGLSVVVIVACAIVAVVAALGIERQNDRDELRAEYSNFASQVIVNLTSFNPKNTDNALKTLEKQTSGRAKTQISDSIQQVTSLVKSTNVETKATVLSSAVTKATDDEGSVIMVYGWEQRSLDGKAAPEYQTFRWRVDMTRINGELKMTNFEWVT